MEVVKTVLLAAVLAVTAGCGLVDTSASDDAIALFHQRLNEQRYDDIIRSATAGFRIASSRQERLAYLDGVHNSLGRHQGSMRTAWSADSGPSGRGVTVTLESDYEYGAAQETFVFVERQEALVLHDYRINSQVFIVGRE